MLKSVPSEDVKTFDKVNWNHVYYFTVIASTGSMRAAAKTLDLQPSTLSEQISVLERMLHVTLFSRKLKRLTLTEDGKRLYRYSKSMFETGQRLLDVISPKSLGLYPITVGLVPSATAQPVLELLIAFSGMQTQNRVRINRIAHEELEALLLEAKIDFGLTDRKSERKDIIQHKVYDGRIKFFGSKDNTSDSLKAAIQSKPLFICRSSQSQFSVVETLLDAYDLHPKSIVSCEYVSVVYRAAEMGAGIAALSEKHFVSRSPMLVEIPAPEGFPDLFEQVYATWAHGSENSASVRDLKAFLTERVKDGQFS